MTNEEEITMDKRPIGVFDSGVGGLTVVKQIMKTLPQENIIYFGDTARLPYGTKSKKTVTKFSKQIVRFLLTKNVKAVIIACNTASSNSLEELRQTFDIPIFGVIVAGVEEALRSTKNKKVGIIGTSSTIKSKAYETLIAQTDKSIEVYAKPCPLFVSLVEEGWTENAVSKLTAEIYLKELIQKGIDSLVLGCTHYPLLKKCIGETVGNDIKLVDPAKATAKMVKAFLAEHKLLMQGENIAERYFYISDDTDTFSSMCKKALKREYIPQIIDIEAY